MFMDQGLGVTYLSSLEAWSDCLIWAHDHVQGYCLHHGARRTISLQLGVGPATGVVADHAASSRSMISHHACV